MVSFGESTKRNYEMNKCLSLMHLTGWYLLATADKRIPPDPQRTMSKRAGSKTVEVKGSHAVCVSQPEAVADRIARVAGSER